MSGLEIFPYPVPDLFCGRPLMVAGKYLGQWPETIEVVGTLPSGQPWGLQVRQIAWRLD